MYIVKVLKRRDAASLVVAIVLAMIVITVLQMPTIELSNRIIGVNNMGYGGPGWKVMYLQPIVSAILQLILLEIALRVFIFLRGKLVRRAK